MFYCQLCMKPAWDGAVTVETPSGMVVLHGGCKDEFEREYRRQTGDVVNVPAPEAR